MADARVKKSTTLKEDLPPTRSDNSYFVRYRIRSNSLFSHWSPIYKVKAPDVIQLYGTVQASGDLISVVWEDEANAKRYDVFVKFDNNNYFYHGSPTTHTYSFLNMFPGLTPSDPKPQQVRVLIQSESQAKEISQELKIFESDVYSLV
jgi:hypothetical protein